MSNDGINELKQRLRDFAEARDWDQFHSPNPPRKNNLTEVITAVNPVLIPAFTNIRKYWDLTLVFLIDNICSVHFLYFHNVE